MPGLSLTLDTASDAFAANRAHTLALIERWRALEARTRAASAKAAPLFDKRGQLLPRERVARLQRAGVDTGVVGDQHHTRAGDHADAGDRSAARD